MKNFEGITFRGTFRDYQQRVLDNYDKHAQDKKINIVAAPGSGKTILGLEIIRRLNSPCLIFSPTVTIRDQWGERFADFFIEDKSRINDYYSSNLNKLELLNSITYQALYSAMNKVKINEEDEIVDYSNIDLIKLVREQGIKTICLDEAHHLQNEWQKALEKFIKSLDQDVTIVALTATPPYDASPEEWQRYQTVCGEIDEEIFVPELVKTNTLCPHQDFIYLNYPTKEEIKKFTTYKNKAYAAMYEFCEMEILKKLNSQINKIKKQDYDFLYSNAKEVIALMVVFEFAKLKNSKKLIKLLTNKTFLPKFSLDFAEIAINFLLNCELTTQEEKDQISKLFKKYSLVERKKVCLNLNESLKKKIYTSLGKLNSIVDIVKSETNVLGKELRMLILTDYIKKETVASVGTNDEFSDISIVSIFETLRRNNIKDIAVLSGALCILPTDLKEYLKTEQKLTAKDFSIKPINSTEYSVFNFKGSNKQKVSIVGKLFAQGKINVLVGTKSLLGEGWDSPCINSLILASFVGSYMLSNQMRGRAIRIDKNNPNKVANIWHLATIEPDYVVEDNALKRVLKKTEEQTQKLQSCDYEMLERRFDCFVGPNYQNNCIESGIDRVTVIKPPYTEQGVSNINQQTLNLSQNRPATKIAWDGLVDYGGARVGVQTVVPNEKKVPAFRFRNFLIETLLLLAMSAVVYLMINCILNAEYFGVTFALLMVLFVLIFVFLKSFNKVVAHLTPVKSFKTLAKAVLNTLKDIGEIGEGCYVKVKRESPSDVSIKLIKGSTREQNIFNTAITELLSPIENPRYILIGLNVNRDYNFRYSFACPTVIGSKKEYAQIFQQYLIRYSGKLQLIYTRNEQGRKFILECRKKSYITQNNKQINRKYKVSNWE